MSETFGRGKVLKKRPAETNANAAADGMIAEESDHRASPRSKSGGVKAYALSDSTSSQTRGVSGGGGGGGSNSGFDAERHDDSATPAYLHEQEGPIFSARASVLASFDRPVSTRGYCNRTQNSVNCRHVRAKGVAFETKLRAKMAMNAAASNDGADDLGLFGPDASASDYAEAPETAVVNVDQESDLCENYFDRFEAANSALAPPTGLGTNEGDGGLGEQRPF